MASVHLDFVPPDRPNIVSLKIWEATTATGAFNVIETVTAIGVFPTYITRYTTDDALSGSDWFRISWVDDKGAETPLSEAVQGGSQTLVGEIINRVMLRDPSLDENVVMQEAQASIEMYFHQDPADVPLSGVSYQVLSGLTLLTMARCYIFTFKSETISSADDYTAGLVSQKGGSSASKTSGTALIDDLLDWANGFLGTNYALVLQMDEIEIAGGQAQEVTVDQTRLIVEIP